LTCFRANNSKTIRLTRPIVFSHKYTGCEFLICSIWLSDHVCFWISLPAVFPFVNFEKLRNRMVNYFYHDARGCCAEKYGIRVSSFVVISDSWILAKVSRPFCDMMMAETFYAFSTNLNVHTPTSSLSFVLRPFAPFSHSPTNVQVSSCFFVHFPFVPPPWPILQAFLFFLRYQIYISLLCVHKNGWRTVII